MLASDEMDQSNEVLAKGDFGLVIQLLGKPQATEAKFQGSDVVALHVIDSGQVALRLRPSQAII